MKMHIWKASADNEELVAHNAVTTYQEWLIVDVREETSAGLLLSSLSSIDRINLRKQSNQQIF